MPVYEWYFVKLKRFEFNAVNCNFVSKCLNAVCFHHVCFSGNSGRPNLKTKTDPNNKIVPNNNGKRNGQKIISGPQGVKWVGRSFKIFEILNFMFL